MPRQPAWIPPMLATLTEPRELGDGWVFETKLDGIRGLAFRSGPRARLLTRNKLAIGQPEIAAALERQPVDDFVIDGEIVAFEGRRTSFAKLQQRGRARVRTYYYVFDLMWLNGEDVRGRPLVERKRLLKEALRFDGPLRLSRHVRGDALTRWQDACAKGLEGLIAKRADSPYAAGRSRDWLKLKCVLEQELVIGGYTDPKGARAEFGALLVGYNEGDTFRYAGEVGTGFTHETLRTLGRELRAREIDRSPFDDYPKPRKGVHWIRPELVAQVGFSEWTRDGRLRHPRFLGLRTDKSPRDVVRERPA